MYKVLCCLNKRSGTAEADDITDSLEKCLSDKKGVLQFREFLKRNRLTEGEKTLEFVLECQRISKALAELSPRTSIPPELTNDIRGLQQMARSPAINFDSSQMTELEGVLSDSTDSSIQILSNARQGAMDLLGTPYRTFRSEVLQQRV